MKISDMKVMLRPVLVLLVLILFSTTLSANSEHERKKRRLIVLTRNMYLGADFGPILSATSFPEFAQEVAEAYLNVQQSNIPQRAAALAKEIESTRPDLIGLQEASIWRTGPFGGPANTVSFDALQSLLDALAARRLRYKPIAILTGFQADAPSALGINIGFVDRDVILARSDLSAAELRLSHIRSGHFATNLILTTPILGPLTIPRGWLSVDGKLQGRRFRFVTSHLESFHPGIQAIQASELILGPASTDAPVIIAGDLNTDSQNGNPLQNAGYQIIVGSGFLDSWRELHDDKPGYTWPLHVGDSLTAAVPTQRIDLVLFRGDVRPLKVKRIGHKPKFRTPQGLWPSDHAGVVASFNLKPWDD